MMEAIRYFLRRMRAPAEPRVLDLQLRDDSFVAVADDGSSRVVEWLDVVRIFTYKVDCWAVNHTGLRSNFAAASLSTYRKTRRGLRTWARLWSRGFPSVSESWFFDVMQPPFAENFTVLVDNSVR